MQSKYLAQFVVATCTGLTFQLGFAAPNLVLNGDFETVIGVPANAPGLQINYGGVTMPNWTSQGTNPIDGTYPAYNMVFNGATADKVMSPGEEGITIWGPHNGSNNGYTASPTGGNFVSADAHEYPGPISQTIHNLTVGQTYALSFDWAVAQQHGFLGDSPSGWGVSFGSQSQSTGEVILLSQGFRAWAHQTYTFTASAADQILAFTALGGSTGSGAPTFALLDGVQLTAAVPEPQSWALLLVGCLGLMGVLKRRTLSSKA